MKSKLPYILIAEESENDRNSLVQELERHIVYAAIEPVESKSELLNVLEDCSWSEYPAMVILSNTDDGFSARAVVDRIISKPCFSDLKIVVMQGSDSEPVVYPDCVRVVQRPVGRFELEDMVAQIDKVLIEELQFC
ncbi:hypothetical protein ACQ86N_26160 [Puia sp. P3]|uniref:hypothetical protein n=1 Tax=Puia sp. P3 TaxID=3423952 RepID=UPI003D6709C0